MNKNSEIYEKIKADKFIVGGLCASGVCLLGVPFPGVISSLLPIACFFGLIIYAVNKYAGKTPKTEKVAEPEEQKSEEKKAPEEAK